MLQKFISLNSIYFSPGSLENLTGEIMDVEGAQLGSEPRFLTCGFHESLPSTDTISFTGPTTSFGRCQK
jgi:hypothetical protein